MSPLDDVLELEPKRRPGRPGLPGGTRRISALVELQTWEAIEARVVASGRSQSQVIRALLAAGLACDPQP
ncbi:MAG: hypothetical protein KC501_25015 [Myxococcales bacterium]|nr:hypothetical protein [Myxococcales bacterium]